MEPYIKYCTGCGTKMEEQPLMGAERFGENLMGHFFPSNFAYEKETGKRQMRRWIKCPNKRWWNESKHENSHAFGEIIYNTKGD